MSSQLDILDGAPRGPDRAPHPEEGVLQAFVDAALPSDHAAQVDAHLAACEPCRHRVAALEALEGRVRGLLADVDASRPSLERPDLDRARWDIRRRRASGRGRGLRRRSAAAAAGLILVAGGVAAAIPGSPRRSLFTGQTSPAGHDSALVATAAADRPGEALPGMTGVAVGFRDARVEVVLEGVEPGTEVEMVIGTGDRVEVLAPEGAQFRAGTGSVVVELGRAGDVLVRIPPGPGTVVLRSGFRQLAQWSGGAFQFGEGVIADPRSDGVRIQVPAESGGGEP
ncbi:hypothetical protein BH23GEM11_BH23GEM11_20190 [soil metagenome]